MIKGKYKMLPAAMLTDVELRRLSWRCRRGLLELDIVLQRFSEHHLASLNADELTAFDRLLDCPDNEFLDVVTSRKEFASVETSNTDALNAGAMQQVLEKLRSSKIEK